jgi:pimeloyl-ACP methyl ester carboxylesterase
MIDMMGQEGEGMTDPLGLEGVRFEERWVEVQDGVELRVLRWTPGSAADRDPVVFVAGWVSVIEGWMPVLRALLEHRPVIYVETREKRSARVDRARRRPRWFAVRRLAEDLIRVGETVGVGDGRATWVGSSMGANAILEALKHERLAARGGFLVGPNAVFRIPWWGHAIILMPAWWYHGVKHFVIWYVRKFRVDEHAEPEQMIRYRRSLNTADPGRLKLSAKAVAGYSVWSELETITSPVAIAFAPTDSLHDADEITEIVRRIPKGRAVECESNAYMHDERIVEDIERFISEIG